MKEPAIGQFLRGQTLSAFQKIGPADGEDLLGKDRFGVKPGPTSLAEEHDDVEGLGIEPAVGIPGDQLQLDLGMRLAKTGDPRQQPAGGDADRDIDRYGVWAMAPADLGDGLADLAKAITDGQVKPLAFPRQGEPRLAAPEQRHRQRGFEFGDLSAHRRLADIELAGRPGEVQMAGRRFEGTQARKRWKSHGINHSLVE